MSYKFRTDKVNIHCPNCQRDFIMSKWFLETAGKKWYLKLDHTTNVKLCTDCQAVKYNYIGDSYLSPLCLEFKNQAMKRTL